MFGRKKPERPDDLLLVVEGTGHATISVCEADGGMVSNHRGTYPESKLVRYPLANGGNIYIGKTTKVADVEAQDIHDLKHSAILQGIFSQPEEDIQSSGKLYVYPIMIVCICLAIGMIIVSTI